jgi:hypothetical protein
MLRPWLGAGMFFVWPPHAHAATTHCPPPSGPPPPLPPPSLRHPRGHSERSPGLCAMPRRHAVPARHRPGGAAPTAREALRRHHPSAMYAARLPSTGSWAIFAVVAQISQKVTVIRSIINRHTQQVQTNKPTPPFPGRAPSESGCPWRRPRSRLPRRRPSLRRRARTACTARSSSRVGGAGWRATTSGAGLHKSPQRAVPPPDCCPTFFFPLNGLLFA